MSRDRAGHTIVVPRPPLVYRTVRGRVAHVVYAVASVQQAVGMSWDDVGALAAAQRDKAHRMLATRPLAGLGER